MDRARRDKAAACCAPSPRTAKRAHAGGEAQCFAALGDGVRLAMLRLLARRPALCVCEIQAAFHLGQPTISHHLRVLREAGLVASEKRGVWVHYSLRRDRLKQLGRALVEGL